jgi:hypothetical protein
MHFPVKARVKTLILIKSKSNAENRAVRGQQHLLRGEMTGLILPFWKCYSFSSFQAAKPPAMLETFLIPMSRRVFADNAERPPVPQ